MLFGIIRMKESMVVKLTYKVAKAGTKQKNQKFLTKCLIKEYYYEITAKLRKWNTKPGQQ